MYGILGEDNSDVDTLKVLIRRLARNDSIPIKSKGYDGCGRMLVKGVSQLKLFADLGCNAFVVCYDSDGADPAERRSEVIRRIVAPAEVNSYCIAIPVQELESWILADIEAVSNVITGWKPTPVNNPEDISSPKEHLENLSRAANKKPRYSHATHNSRVAKYLDIAKLSRKCPSFRPLETFIKERHPKQ